MPVWVVSFVVIILATEAPVAGWKHNASASVDLRTLGMREFIGPG
jgi:hypothetical protein